MRANINYNLGIYDEDKAYFADFDVQFYQVEKDLVNTLKGKYNNIRKNQFFFIISDSVPLDTECHHCTVNKKLKDNELKKYNGNFR